MQAFFEQHGLPLTVLALAFLLTTLPFAAATPFNWDSAQLVLGVHHFSVPMHQPHPPGYPLFVALGKLLAPMWSSHPALLFVSMLLAAAAVLFLYLLIWEIWRRRWLALLAATAFLVNPIFWLYRETALTYTADACAGLALAWLFWRTLATRNSAGLYWSALVLGLGGGFRPSLVVLFVPLWLAQCLLLRRWRSALLSAGVLVLVCLAWYLPLVAVTGGFSKYAEVSAALWKPAAEATSVFHGAPWTAVGKQIRSIALLLGLGWNLLIPAALLPLLARRAALSVAVPRGRLTLLLAAWTGGSFFVYALVHFGPVGYLLTLLPAGYVAACPGLLRIGSLRGAVGRAAAVAGPALLILLPAAIFLVLSPADAGTPPELFQFNRQAIRENDFRVGEIAAAARRLAPDRLVILTSTTLFLPAHGNVAPVPIDETFRKLGVALPDYEVLELAPDRGHYLRSRDWTTQWVSSRLVPLPPQADTLLVAIDGLPAAHWPVGADWETHTGAGGSTYAIGPVPESFQFFGYRFRRQ